MQYKYANVTSSLYKHGTFRARQLRAERRSPANCGDDDTGTYANCSNTKVHRSYGVRAICDLCPPTAESSSAHELSVVVPSTASNNHERDQNFGKPLESSNQRRGKLRPRMYGTVPLIARRKS